LHFDWRGDFCVLFALGFILREQLLWSHAQPYEHAEKEQSLHLIPPIF
jgi:hypothetical protein